MCPTCSVETRNKQHMLRNVPVAWHLPYRVYYSVLWLLPCTASTHQPGSRWYPCRYLSPVTQHTQRGVQNTRLPVPCQYTYEGDMPHQSLQSPFIGCASQLTAIVFNLQHITRSNSPLLLMRCFPWQHPRIKCLQMMWQCTSSLRNSQHVFNIKFHKNVCFRFFTLKN